MDLYIWSLENGRKRPNVYFFGVVSLADNYRKWDRILFERVANGKGMPRPPQLTPEMMDTVRQLALLRRDGRTRDIAKS